MKQMPKPVSWYGKLLFSEHWMCIWFHLFRFDIISIWLIIFHIYDSRSWRALKRSFTCWRKKRERTAMLKKSNHWLNRTHSYGDVHVFYSNILAKMYSLSFLNQIRWTFRFFFSPSYFDITLFYRYSPVLQNRYSAVNMNTVNSLINGHPN